MAWTKAQQKVIDTRNKNLLVSAAAGSGKTAVLVERIISMISEGERPFDIDKLLVVTFTNAAAAEMRERIAAALDKKLCDNPANEHLQKQLSLLQGAQITTIHSFCLYVIRNYFHRIDLDPSFKIADEADIALMKSDVVSDLLERWYEEGREDFHKLIESYSYSKSDAPIEDLILQLYDFSMSSPWPKDWINDKRKAFKLRDLADLYNAGWMQELIDYVGIVINDLAEKNAQAISICNEADGPGAYLPALMSDRALLNELSEAKDYEKLYRLFAAISFDRLSNKREEGVDQGKKDMVKALREEVKKGVKDITGQFFFQSPQEMLKDMQAVNECMQVLFDLTLEFMDDFAARKAEKNLIDFNDIEHYALSILVQTKKNDDGGYSLAPTQAALELSEQFEEILIDEYQDSNMVQETILKSISREEAGSPNRFMVGDVKQSIYKFRLAMPEIFMEKYDKYGEEDLNEDGSRNYYQKIDLDRNFRSRKAVIDFVNSIFKQIMHKQVGGVEYDEAAALKYGDIYDDEALLKEFATEQNSEKKGQYSDRIAKTVDYILVTDEEAEGGQSVDGLSDKDNSKAKEELKPDIANWQKDDEDETDYTKKELEALLIAGKIKELTDPEKGMLVYDKSIKGLRKASYKDIVILLRSMSNWSEIFVRTLMSQGIAAYADTGTGYFQTLEVMTVLNMLRIIDNPRQDIPLVGVLYSPMVGLSTQELARIRICCRKACMYTAITAYAAEGESEELRSKLNAFLCMLEDLRAMVNHTPIHEIIQAVLDKTGYYYYISTMPGGNQRKANLDMLISYAVRFENGSYSGLFHFIRYIEKLHKYEVDFGEASALGEEDDTVRIMSIHKSKGLEFPIVFLAGMNKQFNTQDLKNRIILHNELGAGPEYVDTKLRTRVPTLLKKVIQKKVQIENLGEELRVLYVAMTRAREKLILTGYIKSADEIAGARFTYSKLLSAKSFQDWALPAMMNCMGDIACDDGLPYCANKNGMTISICHKNDFLKQEIARQIFLSQEKDALLSIKPEITYSEKLKEEIRKKISFRYPYEKESGLKIKLTVSELKELARLDEEDLAVNMYEPAGDGTEEENATMPDFIRKNKTEISGADKGSLYHKLLELLDLTRIESYRDLTDQIGEITAGGLISSDDIGRLRMDYIYKFTQSNVAQRMRKAQQSNKLYKEKQFVIGVKASELVPDSNSDELILIQGIIDVFFEEDNEIILLDYKSDYVNNEEELIKRYRTQLDYYSRALTQILHKRVKEMIIYSLPLAKEIRI